jgi:hypothetical protein
MAVTGFGVAGGYFFTASPCHFEGHPFNIFNMLHTENAQQFWF